MLGTDREQQTWRNHWQKVWGLGDVESLKTLVIAMSRIYENWQLDILDKLANYLSEIVQLFLQKHFWKAGSFHLYFSKLFAKVYFCLYSNQLSQLWFDLKGTLTRVLKSNASYSSLLHTSKINYPLFVAAVNSSGGITGQRQNAVWEIYSTLAISLFHWRNE